MISAESLESTDFGYVGVVVIFAWTGHGVSTLRERSARWHGIRRDGEMGWGKTGRRVRLYRKNRCCCWWLDAEDWVSDVLLLSIYSPTYRIFDLMVVRVGNGVGGVSHGVGRVSHDGGCVVGSGHWVTDRGVSVGDGGLQGNLMKGI